MTIAELLAQVLAQPEASNEDIAKTLGVSVGWVRIIRESDAFQHRVWLAQQEKKNA